MPTAWRAVRAERHASAMKQPRGLTGDLSTTLPLPLKSANDGET